METFVLLKRNLDKERKQREAQIEPVASNIMGNVWAVAGHFTKLTPSIGEIQHLSLSDGNIGTAELVSAKSPAELSRAEIKD